MICKSPSFFVSLLCLAFLLVVRAEAQDEQKGKALFAKLKCAECHSVKGNGGCLGPPLDGVMQRRDATYVRMRLNKEDESSFIKLIGHPELMPHPRFSKADVANLISYLNTLPEDKTEPLHHDLKLNASAPDSKSVKLFDLASIKAGKKLFYQSACLACHSVGGTGGSSGPALDKVAERRSVDSIEAFIANPRPASGKQLMPPLKLTERERHQIADFLISLSIKQKK